MSPRARMVVAAAAVASAVVALACGDSRVQRGGRAGASATSCSAKTTCGTCTPVLGCGWCQLDDGSGRCVDDPNDCADHDVFTWTWEPSGCREPADAGVAKVDGGARDASEGDANEADARAAGDATAPTDAAAD